MSSTTLPVCPKTGSTSPSLTVHLCLHTVPGNRECARISSADIDSALAEGIRRGCVSALTEQGFPKYVWGWLGDDLYEARHINGPAGTYKGYRIEKSERPLDRYGRLNREDSA